MTSLSHLHKYLVRRTFTQLVTHLEDSMCLFCQRIRELNPSLFTFMLCGAPVHPNHPVEMLALVISLMDDPDELKNQVRMIQGRQQQLRISNEELQQAGEVLLWVIEQQVGDSFTGDIHKAWLQFYRWLTDLAAEIAHDQPLSLD